MNKNNYERMSFAERNVIETIEFWNSDSISTKIVWKKPELNNSLDFIIKNLVGSKIINERIIEFKGNQFEVIKTINGEFNIFSVKKI